MQKAIDFFTQKKHQNNGKRAEKAAESFLRKQGLKFLSRNFTCKKGEIDLIFMDHTTYVFVEVRFRATDTHGSAAESLDFRKLQRIKHSATIWLQRKEKLSCACRFDAVLFDQEIDQQHLTWLKAVF